MDRVKCEYCGSRVLPKGLRAHNKTEPCLKAKILKSFRDRGLDVSPLEVDPRVLVPDLPVVHGLTSYRAGSWGNRAHSTEGYWIPKWAADVLYRCLLIQGVPRENDKPEAVKFFLKDTGIWIEKFLADEVSRNFQEAIWTVKITHNDGTENAWREWAREVAQACGLPELKQRSAGDGEGYVENTDGQIVYTSKRERVRKFRNRQLSLF